MTGFIRKSVLFVMIFIGLMTIVIMMLKLFNQQLFNNYSTKHINTIFIGDSHMEMGMNDKLIPGSLNLAKSSDGYIHSYVKLKAFLQKEKGIKTIVLSYSAHNLSSYFHTFIDGRDGRFGFADYFPILPLEEKLELINRNKLLGIHSLPLVLNKGFSNLLADSSQYSFLGGYSPQSWQLAGYDHIDKRIKIQFYKDDKLLPFSNIQLDYLEKIYNLCKARRVKLVLIEMPLHEHYREQIPSLYDRTMTSLLIDKSIVWLNCRQLRLPDSFFLPDGDHVNTAGADTTTKYINELLNKEK